MKVCCNSTIEIFFDFPSITFAILPQLYWIDLSNEKTDVSVQIERQWSLELMKFFHLCQTFLFGQFGSSFTKNLVKSNGIKPKNNVFCHLLLRLVLNIAVDLCIPECLFHCFVVYGSSTTDVTPSGQENVTVFLNFFRF